LGLPEDLGKAEGDLNVYEIKMGIKKVGGGNTPPT